MRIVLQLFVSILLTACSAANVLNAIVPHSGYTLHKDIAYGTEPRQRLDIYTPDNIKKPAGVIVFFYGGSWQTGTKDNYRFVGQAFASKGYITVIANYRLYPEVHFPTFMEDSAKAFAWTHNHIQEYGGDNKNLFIAGHSAGAYIAVMLTVNDEYLRKADAKRSWIKGTIGMAGPYDFLPFDDATIKEIFSLEKDTLTQPIHYVNAGLPPMLLVTGDKDTDVRPKNTYNLAAKLRKFGDPVTVTTYPGIAHTGLVLALAAGFRDKAPVLENVDAFIRSIR